MRWLLPILTSITLGCASTTSIPSGPQGGAGGGESGGSGGGTGGGGNGASLPDPPVTFAYSVVRRAGPGSYDISLGFHDTGFDMPWRINVIELTWDTNDLDFEFDCASSPWVNKDPNFPGSGSLRLEIDASLAANATTECGDKEVSQQLGTVASLPTSLAVEVKGVLEDGSEFWATTSDFVPVQ